MNSHSRSQATICDPEPADAADAYAANAANATHAAADAANAAANAADAARAVRDQIRAAFNRLREAASAEGWNDDTPVAPEFFGPVPGPSQNWSRSQKRM